MVGCQASGSAKVAKLQASRGLVSHSTAAVAAIRFQAAPTVW